MRLIIRYFSCEGFFSRLYAYHIRILMHFTRVKFMNIPYFMYQNIKRMTTLLRRKNPEQHHNNIYHYALIKIIVVHQLGLQGITWEDFISRKFFIASAAHQEVVHDPGEPSQQHGGQEAETTIVLTYITYQRGMRGLFVAARRVLSPPGVEGVLLLSSAAQV